MEQSWGPGLLILGAVVLIEGEPPGLSGWGVVRWGCRGQPLPSSPCSLVCVRKAACGVTVRLWWYSHLAVLWGRLCGCLCQNGRDILVLEESAGLSAPVCVPYAPVCPSTSSKTSGKF